MTVMRAKMRINSIEKYETSEALNLLAVSKDEGYPENGLDENNTFAKFTPSANLSIHITNPDLVGKFKAGESYYLDFTKAD